MDNPPPLIVFWPKTLQSPVIFEIESEKKDECVGRRSLTGRKCKWAVAHSSGTERIPIDLNYRRIFKSLNVFLLPQKGPITVKIFI